MRFAEEVAHEKRRGGLRVWARMALGLGKALQTGSSLAGGGLVLERADEFVWSRRALYAASTRCTTLTPTPNCLASLMMPVPGCCAASSAKLFRLRVGLRTADGVAALRLAGLLHASDASLDAAHDQRGRPGKPNLSEPALDRSSLIRLGTTIGYR